MKEIECIVMNITRLLNYIRPYQLRENLIRKLKQQVEQKEKMLGEIKSKMEEFNEHIAECHKALDSKDNPSEVESIRQRLEALIQRDESSPKMDEELIVLSNKHFTASHRT